MKTFRIKETYLVTGWTYVKAETKEQAEELLDSGQVDESSFVEGNYEWKESRGELEEVLTAKTNNIPEYKG